MEIYRHGDVIIQRIDNIPGKKMKQDKTNILVEGEVTGHAHKLIKGEVWKLADPEEMTIGFLKVLEPTKITHEEHNPIELPKGNYKFSVQKEYLPEGWKKVID